VYRKLSTLLFFSLIFVIFLHPISGDGDFFHHLNTGRWVLEQKALPQVDSFTFTAKGLPWVGYAWGAAIFYYSIYALTGPAGINITVALLAVVTFVLLYLWLASYNISHKYILLTLLAATGALSIRWPPRPEIFTYPFLIALFLVDQFKNRYPKLSILFPILILLWANTYGSSVFIGLLLIGLFIIRQLVQDRWKISSKSLHFYMYSFIAFCLSLFNGYGLKTLFYILFIPDVSRIQGEWGGILRNLYNSPIDFQLVFQYWLLIYLLYVVFFLIVVLFSIKKVMKYPFFLLLSGGLLIPIFAFRQVNLGVILSLPLLAHLLSQLKKESIITKSIITLSIISIGISLWINPIGIGQDKDPYSENLISFLQEHDIRGNSFNNQQIGAFLTYHFYPKILTYTDTRDDLFLTTTVLTDFFSQYYAKEGVIPLLAKYKADFVVGDLSDGLFYQPLFYSPDWAIVYLRGHYFVAVKKAMAQEKKLEVLDFVDPFSATQARPGQEEKASVYYKKLTNSSDDEFNDQMRLVYTLFAQKDYAGARFALSKIELGNNPRKSLFSADKDYISSQIAFAQNNCPEAKIYLEKTRDDIEHKFIFPPFKTLPSFVNKSFAFYYLNCERNVSLAKKFLNLFLSQPSITSAEKIQTQKDFNDLLKVAQ